MEIFVSYSHKDKDLAGKIGKLLDRAGQTPFLAHDDIKPTEDWEEEIKKRLNTCSALVAVITPNFVGSAYANQEVGFTMGKGKAVIPLRLGESELPGFVKSSQAIPDSETKLDDAIGAIVQTAEEKAKANYVRPKNFDSLAELVDARLEQRREPYWRVLVTPQGGGGTIPKSSPADKWISDVQNRPRLLTHLISKPTSKGWTFVSKGARYAELTDHGEFCYGSSIQKGETVYIERGIQILNQSIVYAMKLIQQFKLNPPHAPLLPANPTNVYAQLKLGRAHGLSLQVEPVEIIWEDEPHSTDQEEILEYGTLTLEDWQKDPKPFLEQITIQFCRNFGISLEANLAKSVAASALSG
jgi:hypothetical protein